MKNLYLKRAEENNQELNEYIITPQAECKPMNKGDDIVIDLGNHYVGYFSFSFDYADVYIDAPVRLCIRFCETERELEDDFSAYCGKLCKSWLQEEIINLDFPDNYKLPRRYAARYIKIFAQEATEKLILSDFVFRAVSSADINELKPCETEDNELKEIDLISSNTLKNCMQRVFEDGPKRDRRLWIGDLRLEALVNYYTFNNPALVRRCLYLFAAADVNESGFLPAYVYENTKYVSGYWFLQDYALLFVVSVCDYYNHTQDKDTFNELYPVIKSQMESIYKTLDEDGIVTVCKDSGVFIDWCEGLEKITSLHGVYMYALKMLSDVLKEIKSEDAGVYAERYNAAYKSAANTLYDKEKNTFINKKDNYQFSVHSYVWMILAGVLSGEKAKEALRFALTLPDSIKPLTPYLHHYVTEALVKLGMLDEAAEYIKNCWGGMAKLGADTFFEAYVPQKPDFSPYGDRMVNSMCHGWSCTPAYFIRRYFSDKK